MPIHSIPIHSIALNSIPIHSIPIHSIDLAGTPIHSIPIHSIDLTGGALGALALADIPAEQRDAVVDCDEIDCSDPRITLGDAARLGAIRDTATFDDIDEALAGISFGDLVGAIPDKSAQDFRDALSGFTLADVTDFDNLTLGEIPALWDYLTLGGLGDALAGYRLGDIAGHIDGFTADDVRDALGNLTLADLTGFDDLTLGELTAIHEYLTFGDLEGLLTGVRLGDLVGIISDGSGGTYDEADLRAALEQAVGADAELGDLGPDFDDLTLGELTEYGDTTIGQLLDVLDEAALDGITLGDLLLTLIARSQYPWEDLNLENALSQSLDENEQSVPVSVAIEAEAPDGRARDVQVTVRPPDGSVMVPGSATLTVPGHADELTPTVVDGALVWTFTALPAGAVHTLAFALEPTVRIGVERAARDGDAARRRRLCVRHCRPDGDRGARAQRHACVGGAPAGRHDRAVAHRDRDRHRPVQVLGQPARHQGLADPVQPRCRPGPGPLRREVVVRRDPDGVRPVDRADRGRGRRGRGRRGRNRAGSGQRHRGAVRPR